MVREKTGWEIAQLAVPAVIAAGGALGAILTAISQKKNSDLRRRELQQAEIRCPLCQKKIVPTKIITKKDPTLLSKVNFLSQVEENYTGCPICKKAISWCSYCKRVTASFLSRELDLTLSKTGYQNVQKCKVCTTKV